MVSHSTTTLSIFFLLLSVSVHCAIDRRSVVSLYNPRRNASSSTTPLQVGNGHFAFGADITGLQTFLPFVTLSDWGWKHDPLPENKTWADVEAYHGTSWLNHGRPVEYDFGGDKVIEKWLIANPNRVNLGRIGLTFPGFEEVMEKDLVSPFQELDLVTGILNSTFILDGEQVQVMTASSQSSSSVSVSITSPLISSRRLAVFVDFPYSDGTSKFNAPFVGRYNDTDKHTTKLTVRGQHQARITHSFHSDNSSIFHTIISGDAFSVARDSPNAHRYTFTPITSSTSDTFAFVATFTQSPSDHDPSVTAQDVFESSSSTWKSYWDKGGFVDLTGTNDERASELQRRIILSRYLMRVNAAGSSPPQESGLVNNGWYGKFHMEMYYWHAAHWALWDNWEILGRALHRTYSSFLDSSIHRSQVQQGWKAGARWPKMTDPSGRSTPGQINNLLIWQQPHPLVFASYEYRAFPTLSTLRKWQPIVQSTADFMAAFAWKNATSGFYDLGPPVHVVSEDTQPNNTVNPAFELAYWKLGLGIAEQWMKSLGEAVPEEWTDVKNQLAKLPVSSDGRTYAIYEGIDEGFWEDKAYINDHPALVGLHGWLPPSEELDLQRARETAEKVWASWNLTNCWGWDFPMLAMSAARNGDSERAVSWLLDPLNRFDDAGYPIGGVRVPTPYFPASGGLLLAVAMMAGGWDGSDGPHAPGFPANWTVVVEGIGIAL